MPRTVRGHLEPRRHTALLIAIVAAFAVRPLVGDAGLAPLVFSFALLIIVFVALYNIRIDELVGEREILIHRRRRWLSVACALAFLSIAERVMVFVVPNPPVIIGDVICWLLLLSLLTFQELRAVFRQRRVTGQTISLAISHTSWWGSPLACYRYLCLPKTRKALKTLVIFEDAQ